MILYGFYSLFITGNSESIDQIGMETIQKNGLPTEKDNRKFFDSSNVSLSWDEIRKISKELPTCFKRCSSPNGQNGMETDNRLYQQRKL